MFCVQPGQHFFIVENFLKKKFDSPCGLDDPTKKECPFTCDQEQAIYS